jgi:hypothetical protein
MVKRLGWRGKRRYEYPSTPPGERALGCKQVIGWRTDGIAEGPVSKARCNSQSSVLVLPTGPAASLSQCRPNALYGSPHPTTDRVQTVVLPYMSAAWPPSLSRVCLFMLGICSPR